MPQEGGLDCLPLRVCLRNIKFLTHIWLSVYVNCNLEVDGDDFDCGNGVAETTNLMPYKSAAASLTLPGGVVPAVPHFSIQHSVHSGQVLIRVFWDKS